MSRNSGSPFKRVIHVLVNILFYCIVVFCVFSLIDKWIFQDANQSVFGYRAECVMSGSMEDTLSVGDIVVIKEAKTYSKNDIVSFREGNSVITHRIIDIADDGFITKGDANNAADSEVVKQGDVIGREILIIPWIGYIRIALMSPVGLILVLSICGVLYFVNRQIEEREEATDEE